MAGRNTAEERRQAENRALALDEILHNCEYYIQEYVHIEDKDSDVLATKFALWPNQKAGLKTILTHRLVVALKARQLGFSWLALAYASWVMLKPGRSVLALSKTEEDAKELVRRMVFILRYLPGWMIRQSNAPDKNMMVFDSLQTAVTIYHPNGEPSVFKSFPAAQNSGAGFTANLLILDEWALQQYAYDIWRAAFPTINRPTGGQVIGISTIRLGTLFEDVVRGALDGKNDFKLVFWPWNTDPRRDDAWIERTKRNMSDEQFRQEYPATVEEALASVGGRFFGELNAEVHCKSTPQTIPKEFRRYASIDYGLDGLAVLWYCVDYDGRSHAYRELYTSDKTISEAASLILAANSGDKLSGFFAPPDLWNRRQDTGKSFYQSFLGFGITLLKTDNRREQGWVAVKELLHPRKFKHPQTDQEMLLPNLTIDKDACPNLWRCLTTIQSAKNNKNDVADQPHELTHLPDSLRCYAAGWLLPVDGYSILDEDDEEADGFDSFIDYGK